MKRSNEIEQILDECLERIFAGETVEDCLKDHPQHAGELRPLLETVAGTREAVDIKPRSEFREQAARDFQAAVRDMQPVKSRGFFRPHRWLATAVSAVLVVLLAGGGTVAAANNSLPDSPLYSVKLAAESARIALAFDDEGKAELHAEFANRRVNEIVAMAEAGNVDGVNRATDRLNGELLAMADIYRDGEEPTLTTSTDSQMLTSQESRNADGGSSTPVTTAATTTSATMAAETPPEPAATRPDITLTQPPATYATDEKALTFGALEDDNVSEIPGAASGEWSENELRNSVMEDALSNAIKLEQVKEDASDSLREALERAIEIAMMGYDVAIRNIR